MILKHAKKAGKEAEKALEGSEGDELRDAEKRAKKGPPARPIPG